MNLSEQLLDHVRSVCAAQRAFANEQEFHSALAASLGDCENKVRVEFDPPAMLARIPPASAIEECERKGKTLPSQGKDPCSGRRVALDVVWRINNELVPIELKYRPHWNSDVYGYGFLKDLHRLERLRLLAGLQVPATHRYAVFLTPIADYWSGGSTREPAPFRLNHGRSIKAGYWVQYNQPSAATQWHDYPPFHLSRPYTFEWHDVGIAGRCLIVRVEQQTKA